MKKQVSVVHPDGSVEKKEIEVKERGAFGMRDSKYLSLGYYLIIPLLLGLLMGMGIDKAFKTDPMFTLIGLVLGTISTFYNLFNILKNG